MSDTDSPENVIRQYIHIGCDEVTPEDDDRALAALDALAVIERYEAALRSISTHRNKAGELCRSAYVARAALAADTDGELANPPGED